MLVLLMILYILCYIIYTERGLFIYTDMYIIKDLWTLCQKHPQFTLKLALFRHAK